MTEKEMQIFDGLIAEYELRAKYNDDQRDYEAYSMLVKARGILSDADVSDLGINPYQE